MFIYLFICLLTFFSKSQTVISACPFFHNNIEFAVANFSGIKLYRTNLEIVPRSKQVYSGSTVRKIVHQESSGTYGIISDIPDSNSDGPERSFFEILSDRSFERTHLFIRIGMGS